MAGQDIQWANAVQVGYTADCRAVWECNGARFIAVFDHNQREIIFDIKPEEIVKRCDPPIPYITLQQNSEGKGETMKVHLSSCGNPDHGQDPNRPVWGVKPRKVSVKSLREASEVCRTWIEENDLGGGNWTGGQVFDDNGAQIARVSYNGRVWDMDENEISITPKKPAKTPSFNP